MLKKTIGIIGAGNIAQAIARHLIKAGHHVMLSNLSGPEKMENVIIRLGKDASGVTVANAASADIVVLALPWIMIPLLADQTEWKGKTVIDATNPFITFDPPVLAELGGRGSSEIVSDQLNGAIIIKAFNTLPYQVLASDPEFAGGRRVIFYAGDDLLIKKEIKLLIESMHFAAIDNGSLASSENQAPKGSLGSLNLIRFNI